MGVHQPVSPRPREPTLRVTLEMPRPRTDRHRPTMPSAPSSPLFIRQFPIRLSQASAQPPLPNPFMHSKRTPMKAVFPPTRHPLPEPKIEPLLPTLQERSSASPPQPRTATSQPPTHHTPSRRSSQSPLPAESTPLPAPPRLGPAPVRPDVLRQPSFPRMPLRESQVNLPAPAWLRDTTPASMPPRLIPLSRRSHFPLRKPVLHPQQPSPRRL